MGRSRGRKIQGPGASRMVRIVAGRWGGRTLAAPASQTTRPTTDRVKEAEMSSLYSARGGFEGACVLDAFAGSGALGLEALSRGAARVCFCESDPAAARVLRSNIAALPGAAAQTEVHRGDAFALAGSMTAGPFDLVLLDPPYAFEPERIARFVEDMRLNGILADGALVCYEHSRSSDSDVRSEFERIQWSLLKEKSYGDISFAVLRKEQA